MLFTDRSFITPQDISSVDFQAIDDAAQPDNPVNVQTAIDKTIEDMGNLILSRCQAIGSLGGGLGWASYNGIPGQVYKAFFTGIRTSNIPTLNLPQIVVSNFPPSYRSAIQNWAIYSTLASIYSELSDREVADGDRFLVKRERYSSQVEENYFPILRSQGLPFVTAPFSCPGALHGPLLGAGPGTWSVDNLSAQTLAGAPSQTYTVAISWVDQSKYFSPNYQSPAYPNNCESGLSLPVKITVPIGKTVGVDITSLFPPLYVPDGSGSAYGYGVGSSSVYAPHTATHWNIYAAVGDLTGLSQPQLFLQSLTPIPIASKTVMLNSLPLSLLYPSTQGQIAEAMVPFPEAIVRRG